MYETGAWRVHTSHTRVLTLARQLGLATRPARGGDARRQLSMDPDHVWTARSPGFRDTVTCGPGYISACAHEYMSGYPGSHDGAMSTYITPPEGEFVVLEKGWSALVEAMIENRGHVGPLDVRYGNLVTDIKRENDIYHVYVLGSSNVIRCHEIFICIPPHICRGWSVIAKYATAVVSTVGTRALHHIYARGTCPSKVGYALHPRLGQIIDNDHDTNFFQISYTSGRMADAWGKVAQTPAFEAVVRDAARDVMTGPLTDISSHYWPHAVHFWSTRPNDRPDWLNRCAAPHPVHLPGLWFCGEAFSDWQGWCEGALQTVELVIGTLRHKPSDSLALPRIGKVGQYDIVVDGRVLNVRDWINVHPGGPANIVKYLGQSDISDLLRKVGHSANAWAAVLGLQYAWVY